MKKIHSSVFYIYLLLTSWRNIL